jgi:hypothetical protein
MKNMGHYESSIYENNVLFYQHYAGVLLKRNLIICEIT